MQMWWTGVLFSVLAQMPPDGAAQMKKVDRLLPELRRMAADPEVVRQVLAQNARRVPLATIQQQDAAWSATPALPPFKQQVLDSPCSHGLRRHHARLGRVVAEAFVMDDKGALVGATRRTSDYWQGDEAKWSLAFRGTEVHDLPFFDESSQAYILHVSVPVRDGTRVIGAIALGVSLLDL